MSVLTVRAGREFDHRGNESIGTTGPRLPSGQHTIGVSDRRVVTSGSERPAGRKDVREKRPVNAYFQDSTVKSALRVEVIPERKLNARINSRSGSIWDRHYWCR